MNHSFEIRSGIALALRNLYASHYSQYDIEVNSIMDSDADISSNTSSDSYPFSSPDSINGFYGEEEDVKVWAKSEDIK